MRRAQKFGLGMALMVLTTAVQAGALDEVTIDVIERGDRSGSHIIQRIELPVPSQDEVTATKPEQSSKEIRDVIRQGSDLRRLRGESIREKVVRP